MEEVLHGWLNKASKRDVTHDNGQHQQTLQRLVMAFRKLVAITIVVNRKLAAISSPSCFDLLHLRGQPRFFAALCRSSDSRGTED